MYRALYGGGQLSQMPSIETLVTARLSLRSLGLTDADFIYALVNEPDWLTYIGDKGVHNLEDAIRYIQTGPHAMYRQHGFGLMVVETLSEQRPIGLCGLLQRDNLSMPDLGFAFLAQARGQGYALEAAKAVIDNMFEKTSVLLLAAITAKNNQPSMALLAKLGFVFKSLHHMDEKDAGSNLFELSKADWLKTP